QQQPVRIRHQCWILSLLLLLAPLISLAQWAPEATGLNMDDMEPPCHQTEMTLPDQQCNHCSGLDGILACDCCQGAVSPSLTMEQTRVVHIPSHSELNLQVYTRNRPNPPPGSLYRPPIQNLI
ncbi:MAG: hypothetical protein QNJ78_12910, partial [Gammaproteobacteria bacterium]|nr:hypothetical protein [Gammaproteobacteria bacterium]